MNDELNFLLKFRKFYQSLSFTNRCTLYQSYKSFRFTLKLILKLLLNVSSGSLQLSLAKVGDRGGRVVKVLCYKSEGRWFDPSWCNWNFSLT